MQNDAYTTIRDQFGYNTNLDHFNNVSLYDMAMNHIVKNIILSDSAVSFSPHGSSLSHVSYFDKYPTTDVNFTTCVDSTRA